VLCAMLLAAGLALAARIAPSAARPAAPIAVRTAVLAEIDGAIGPATSSFVTRVLDDAARQSRALVILRIDTPGGLETSMRDIIKAILASPVPVVSYVAPSGARAASAGTYILYASQLAAMAPATNLGAATPVAVGGGDLGGARPGADGGTKEPGAKSKPAEGSAMEHKVINDAVSYIRGLAQLRGRNAAWAESAVRTGASLPASEALQQHVVDLIARDVPDLLRQAHGRRVKVAGQELLLDTRALLVTRVEPDWRTRLLAVLTHPTIAYGLLLAGIYGLLLEGYNPGAILPGVAGATSLLFALYAFQLLSVNYAGLALIVLGVGLMITEFFVHAFGSLVIGGLISFVLGSMLLLDNGVPGLEVARPVIAAIALAGGLMGAAIIVLAARARRRPVATGIEAMLGARAEVVGDFSERGTVRLGAELWTARSTRPLRTGQAVRVVKVEGLVLVVEPAANEAGGSS
jgi:membrane-bound serine protease (ClpP class)